MRTMSERCRNFDWKLKLKEICDGYALKDIFKMNETGLFYTDTSKSTLNVKGDDCAGRKHSKEIQ